MKHLHNDQDVVCIASDASLREAAQALQEHGIGCLVVCDRDGRTVGIVTDRDLALRAVAWERDPDATRVGSVMTSDVRCAPVDADREAQSDPMRRLGVRRVPLLDDERRPRALFSIDDWLRWLAARLHDVAAAADPAHRHGPLHAPELLLDQLTEHVEQRQLLDREELLESIERLRNAVTR